MFVELFFRSLSIAKLSMESMHTHTVTKRLTNKHIYIYSMCIVFIVWSFLCFLFLFSRLNDFIYLSENRVWWSKQEPDSRQTVEERYMSDSYTSSINSTRCACVVVCNCLLCFCFSLILLMLWLLLLLFVVNRSSVFIHFCINTIYIDLNDKVMVRGSMVCYRPIDFVLMMLNTLAMCPFFCCPFNLVDLLSASNDERSDWWLRWKWIMNLAVNVWISRFVVGSVPISRFLYKRREKEMNSLVRILKTW